ncbi:hypothetical protein BH11PSE7_BH11PSE7_36910 [soil metagenome]
MGRGGEAVGRYGGLNRSTIMRFLIAIEPRHKNITLPRRVLNKLDAAVRAAGETRSGYIAHLALQR